MRIIELKAENFKKLKAVQIVPDKQSGTVILKGNNAQGKSSVLDAITAALTGKNFEEPIRDGQGNAEVVLDLDDIIITRRWTKKASYLTITSKNGDKYASPQKMLDGMTNILSFDPSSIVLMKESEQIALLKKLTGLDTSDIDETIKTKYDQRTNVNREADSYKVQADGIVAEANLPTEEISISSLTKKLEEINEYNKSIDDQNLKLTDLQDTINRAYKNLDEQDESIKETASEIESLEDEIIKIQEKILKKKEQIKSSQDLKNVEIKKIAELDVQQSKLKKSIENKKTDKEVIVEIEKINETNAKIREANKKNELISLQKQKEAESEKLTKEIEKAKQEKIDLVANTKMPIEGLYFDNAGIKYNDKPLSSCSDAEKIKIGLSIALASNPKIKVILMKQGSFLDESSLKLVSEMAQANDAQVWIEKVGAEGSGILIEDGEIGAEF